MSFSECGQDCHSGRRFSLLASELKIGSLEGMGIQWRTLFSSSRLSILGLVLLSLYGGGTALFTAKVTGITVDESTYQRSGYYFWEGKPIHDSEGFPPFAVSMAAWYPYHTHIPLQDGLATPFVFRLFSVALYFFVGVVSLLLLARVPLSPIGLWVFGALYFLCPNLKALSSLGVTDGPSAELTLLSGVLLWLMHKRRDWSVQIHFVLIALAFCSQGLALCSKISAIFFLPFMVGLVVYRFLADESQQLAQKWIRLCISGCIAVLSLLFVILLTHRFELGAFQSLFGIYQFQKIHSQIGHSAFMLGKHRVNGFLYFYIVSLLFKLTPAVFIFISYAAVYGFKLKRKLCVEILFLIAPVVLLFMILSTGKVQTGLRYFLPGLSLGYLWVAMVWSESWESAISIVHRKPWIVVGLILSLMISDAWTVSRGAYLSYFNFMAPNPTRRFADSNIDWGQKIPTHLMKEYPNLSFRVSPYDIFDRGFSSGSALIGVGATSLVGLWSKWSPILKQLVPIEKIAGHEIFSITPAQFYRALAKEDLKVAVGDSVTLLGEKMDQSTFKLQPGRQLLVFRARRDLGEVQIFMNKQLVHPILTLGTQNHLDSLEPIEWRLWIQDSKTINLIEVKFPLLTPVLVVKETQSGI